MSSEPSCNQSTSAQSPDIARRASSTDPHRGFGYVEFSLPEDAREAIDNMNQAELYGRTIKVNQARPQKDASDKLGSRTAVWEQVRAYAVRRDLWIWEADELLFDVGRLCSQIQRRRRARHGRRSSRRWTSGSYARPRRSR